MRVFISGRALLRQSGVATLFDHIRVSERLPARLLGQLDGERVLTDLGHVAELLYAQATEAQLGLAALRAWLARRMSEAGSEVADAEQYTRRLDSDSDAVEILTVHRAKGLEFPVVYCPFLWDSAVHVNRGGPVVFHDPDDRTGANSTWAANRRPRVRAALFGQPGRGPRRGSASPVRRPHPGQAPGRHLVGRCERLPVLSPRPPLAGQEPERRREDGAESERSQGRQGRSRTAAKGGRGARTS